ncbi:OmpA family protein [Luteibaculum oceani]|uniref:OmpA family protein n=1 Tax=Luteibaculum oceani TaxID=1294296 RepID=A0A5C6V8I4_9FLAO|nr:OmpA family protein [Luteibaculum oceani]TXC81349.1 OmpA family protein [Luteibaculum oceani]
MRTFIARSILFGVLLFLGNIIAAQETCDAPEGSRKIRSLVEEVMDTTKNSEERLSAAIALKRELPESKWALYQKTELQYWRNWSYQKPVEVLEDELLEIIETCIDQFPLSYYYLGNIAYLKGNPEEAKSRYQEFIKYSRGAENVPLIRLREAKESIGVLDFQAKVDEEAFEIKIYPLAGVNTADQEYLPAISPDNRTMFFTKKFPEKLLGEFRTVETEKLMSASRMGVENEFFQLSEMEHPFNSGKGNYGGLATELTGKEIFLTICNRSKSGYANCDIFRSEKRISAIEDGRVYYYWEEFDTLGTQINHPEQWESQPTISADGLTMLYSKYSDYTNGIDIYISKRDSIGGIWSDGKPLGGKVNTAGNEKAPFLHPDGETLYFSSDGHMGLGGYDLFVSRLKDGIWEKPRNLGKPINTEKDEHGLIVSTDGKYAYFASNTINSRGDYDIMTFELPDALRPEEIVVYKGFVDNPTDGATMELSTVDGKKIKDINVSSGDGMFATIVKKKDLKDPIVATVKKKGYAFTSELVDLENEKAGLIDSKKLGLKEIQTDEPYRINDINFSSNSYELTRSAKSVLMQFAEFLKINPSYSVDIQGHTDNIGGAAANKELSINRALAVKKYLISLGIKANRLGHVGFGQEQPLESNETEEGRAKNRRTEFVLRQR